MTDANSSEKAVVVVGMHRSGTSLTAGILSLLGVRMGSTSRPAVSNVKSDFEDHDFRELNREILHAHDARWDDPPDPVQMEVDAALNEKARSLVKRKEGGVWGWKDPRTVFTLDYYLPHLTNPYFIFVSRDAHEVARSLSKRDYTPLEQNLALAKQYEQQIDSIIRKTTSFPQLFLTMESITQDPVVSAKKIVNFLDLDASRSVYEKVRAFVLPQRKRRLITMLLRLRYLHRTPRQLWKRINRNKERNALYKGAYVIGKKILAFMRGERPASQ